MYKCEYHLLCNVYIRSRHEVGVCMASHLNYKHCIWDLLYMRQLFYIGSKSVGRVKPIAKSRNLGIYSCFHGFLKYIGEIKAIMKYRKHKFIGFSPLVRLIRREINPYPFLCFIESYCCTYVIAKTQGLQYK